MFKIIKKSQIDWATKHVVIEVYEEAFNALKTRLCEVSQNKHHKSLYNTIRLYLFLRVMNECKITHIAKEDLARMFFSKHTERLKIPIECLEAASLLEAQGNWNDARHHYYYTYITKGLDVTVKDKSKTRIFEMDIPDHVNSYLKLPQQNAIITNAVMKEEHSRNLNNNHCNQVVVQDPFLPLFTGWYNELLFSGANPGPGHFSEADGRFYHLFHCCPTDYRNASVTWDGEPLVEYWDAHSAFFIVLCFVLRKHVEYPNDELRETFNSETEKMLRLAISGGLYLDVLRYHNDRTDVPVNKDTIKEWCQIYKGVSYDYLFRKKDGEYKESWYVKRLRYIDEYFKKEFPNIRNYLLNYPRIEVEDKNRRQLILVNGQYVYANSPKTISRIHKDFMPYEFQLISIGLCKRIYNKYGIRCLTVHDAIYMKQSDSEKTNIDVNRLLEIELGLRVEEPIPLW